MELYLVVGKLNLRSPNSTLFKSVLLNHCGANIKPANMGFTKYDYRQYFWLYCIQSRHTIGDTTTDLKEVEGDILGGRGGGAGD